MHKNAYDYSSFKPSLPRGCLTSRFHWPRHPRSLEPVSEIKQSTVTSERIVVDLKKRGKRKLVFSVYFYSLPLVFPRFKGPLGKRTKLSDTSTLSLFGPFSWPYFAGILYAAMRRALDIATSSLLSSYLVPFFISKDPQSQTRTKKVDLLTKFFLVLGKVLWTHCWLLLMFLSNLYFLLFLFFVTKIIRI